MSELEPTFRPYTDRFALMKAKQLNELEATGAASSRLVTTPDGPVRFIADVNGETNAHFLDEERQPTSIVTEHKDAANDRLLDVDA